MRPPNGGSVDMAAKRPKLKLSGDEADAASRKARRLVPFQKGELRKIKRRMNKRARRTGGDRDE